MAHRLDALAERFGLTLHGDGSVEIAGVCTLANGRPDAITFLANRQYRKYLADTRAGAVIVAASDREAACGPVLVADDPYLAYARIAALFAEPPAAWPAGGFHVHPDADLADDVTLAPGVCVGAGAHIGAGGSVGPNTVIGAGARIGDQARIGANVSIGEGVRIGDRVLIHAGAVIGGRGFGLAQDAGAWVEVPQLGSVAIGDDVEIGANAAIDRGAVEDTVIGDGVKIDNLVQIAHNVRVGDHTAIAAMAGIAGSSEIGGHCLIGGAVGVTGHVKIGDRVAITGMTLVSRSIDEPGMYSSGWPVTTNGEWRKQVARLRRLDKLDARVKSLESRLAQADNQDSDPGE